MLSGGPPKMFTFTLNGVHVAAAAGGWTALPMGTPPDRKVTPTKASSIPEGWYL